MTYAGAGCVAERGSHAERSAIQRGGGAVQIKTMLEEVDVRQAEARKESHDFKRAVVLGAEDPRTKATQADAFVRCAAVPPLTRHSSLQKNITPAKQPCKAQCEKLCPCVCEDSWRTGSKPRAP